MTGPDYDSAFRYLTELQKTAHETMIIRNNLKIKAELERALCNVSSTSKERVKMLPYLLKDIEEMAQHVLIMDGVEYEYTRGMYYKKSHTMEDKTAFGQIALY